MRKIIFSLLFISILSCKKDSLLNGSIIISNPTLAAELKNNNEKIIIGDRNYLLEAYIYRNFMPDAESGLICIIKLKDINGSPIPSDITIDKLYVINDIDIWKTNYDEIRTNSKFYIEGIVRNGPKWETKTNVDIVCEFLIGSKKYQILIKSQKIGEVY
jgi:hypothetical protein